MTAVPKEQFKGATRKGIEDIRSVLSDAGKTVTSAIHVALEEHNETAVDVFHRSERAAAIDWVNFKDRREQSRKSLIETPFYILAFFALIGVVSTVLVACASNLSIPKDDAPPISFMVGCAALALAYPFGNALKELIKEARLGYTSWFKLSMRFRVAAAWAISNEAVYAARLSRTHEEMVEVARVPFDDVQACVYADWDGLQTTLLFTKNGESFVLSEPVGTSLSGAANLANHIWSMTRR